MPIIDNYASFGTTPDSPCRRATAVVPSDITDLSCVSRLYVGGSGDLVAILADDTAPVTFKDVSGFLPVLVKRVFATNTTATFIVAAY